MDVCSSWAKAAELLFMCDLRLFESFNIYKPVHLRKLCEYCVAIHMHKERMELMLMVDELVEIEDLCSVIDRYLSLLDSEMQYQAREIMKSTRKALEALIERQSVCVLTPSDFLLHLPHSLTVSLLPLL